MKKIKAILVGAGGRGARTYAPYALEHKDELEFVAVAEPIATRREKFIKDHNIKEGNAFNHYNELFKHDIEADVVLVCTQDQLHVEPCIVALEKGYHVLLEKPIAPSEEECIEIAEAVKKTNKSLTICHVLRYTSFFKKIKELIDTKVIGDLVSITHNENVGYWHAAHSYVRGNWRNTAESSPMILAKSCHDIDMLLWLAGSNCEKVSSFGSLRHFVKEKAPEGSTLRCTDGCKVEDTCPYSALKLYMDENNTSWPIDVITEDFSKEGRLKALETGPYGRCVYQCDNDVVDHQAVIMEFEDGVTATFHMNSFTYDTSRTIKICGTMGEIIAKMEDDDIRVYDFATNTCKKIDLTEDASNSSGHGGGDYGLISSLIEFLQDPEENTMVSNALDSVQSHLVCFTAERSRLNNETMKMKRFE